MLSLTKSECEFWGKKKLPSLQGVFSIIQVEEVSCLTHNPQTLLPWFPQKQVMEGSRGMLKDKEAQLKSLRMNSFSCGVWCTYDKKSRHTKKTCWKLHGKP